MAKKKPGTGKQDDEVEEEELDEEIDEGADETEDESETDDEAADDEAGDDESDEDDEPTAEELKAQLAKMQRALKKANREAASRRIELEALKKKPAPKAGDKAKGKGDKADTDNDEAEELRTLREQNEKLLAEQRRNGARLAIAKAARKAKINWANDTARDDAVELILRDAVINEDGTIDDIADLLADVVEERPHLLAAKAGNDKKPRAGDTSATKRGSRTDLALDEDEIAQQFGIRDHRSTKK